MIGRAGPKVSSWTSSLAGSTRSRTGGTIWAADRSPPVRSAAPSATAAATRRSTSAAAPSSIRVPTSVAGSSGSPTRRAALAAVILSASSSAIGDSARIRLTAVQRWPLFRVPPATASDAASARSASRSTSRGSLPPSSSTTRLYPAWRAISSPTLTPPVNITTSVASCPSSSARIASRSPVTTATASAG